MDIIKLDFTEPKEYKTVDFKGYEIILSLNDENFKNSLLNFVEVLSLIDLHFAEFDLFTCSCGIPGCAGYHYSVLHTVEDGIVTWTFPESNDYRTGKKVYRFDLISFKKVLKETIKRVKHLEKENIYHLLLIRDETDYVGFEDSSETIHYTIKNKFMKEFKYTLNHFTGRQNFYDMLHSEFAGLMNKKFYWVYDGVQSKKELELDILIGNILNQYPSQSHEPYFLAKCKLAINAILDLTKGNTRLFEKLTKHGYERCELNSYHAVDYYLSKEVTEENFDVSKLHLIMQD